MNLISVIAVLLAFLGAYSSTKQSCTTIVESYEDCLASPSCDIAKNDLYLSGTCSKVFGLVNERLVAMDAAELKYSNRD